MTNLPGDPPELSITIPKLEDLQVTYKKWELNQLPTDVLWLTVTDDEFLACFSYLCNAFKSYRKELGFVYFGEVGDGAKKVKVSLIRCSRGSIQVGAAPSVTQNAVRILKPKAVFSVGYCGGLKKEKAKLGDVVISSKLSTYDGKKFIGDEQQCCGSTINVSRHIGDLIRTAAHGWRAPLLDPEALKLKVHSDGEILSCQSWQIAREISQKLVKQFPGAIAIEAEGQGLYTAAFDLEIEWVVIKGISHYVESSECGVKQWEPFASAMAASVTVHILKESDVLKNWRHYQGTNESNVKEPSGFCVLPPKPSHCVAKRKETVSRLGQKMQELRCHHRNSVTSLYLSGNPGCGKTQMARLLGEAMYAENNLSFVFTLGASSAESLYNSMFHLALKLDYDEGFLQKEISEGSYHEKLNKLCSLVSVKANSRRCWLLIVDGLGVRGFKEEMNFWGGNHGIQNWGAGQLIITTQREDDIPVGDNVMEESLKNGLGYDEAVNFLKELSFSGQQDESIEETLQQVVEELDYQPLALANAGIYTAALSKAKKKVTWRDYLEKLRTGKRELMENRAAKKNKAYSYGMVVATRLVVEELLASCEIFKHIFVAFSFCANAIVPAGLIASYVKKNMENVEDDEVLMVLKDCCLFLWNEDSMVNSLMVHRVVYRCFVTVLHKKISYSSRVDFFCMWLTNLESFVKLNIAEENPSTYATLSLLKVHLPKGDDRKQCFITPTSNSTDPTTEAKFLPGEFLSKVTAFRDVYHRTFDLKNDLNCTNYILKILRSIHGNNHPDTISNLNHLGNVYKCLGDLKKAEEHYLEALKIWKSYYGDSHSDVATSLNNLGLVYKNLGDLKKAEEHCLEALKIRKSCYGDSHPDVALSLNNLGLVYDNLGDLKKAEEHFLEALKIRKTCYGDSHRDVALSLNSLGLVYTNLGDLKKAEEHYLEALKILKSCHGDSHPDVALCLNDLGLVYSNLGDLKKAEEHCLEALKIWKLCYRDSHPDVALCLINLGLVYSNLGDLKKAEEHYLEALKIWKSCYGDSHPYVAASLNNLGFVYANLGDLKKAEEHYLEALKIWKTCYGDSHPDVATSFNNLGLVYASLGDLKKAEKHYLEAVKIWKTCYGDSHPNVAASLNNLGLVYRNLGGLKKAEEHCLEALKIRKTCYGNSYPDVALSLNSLGLVYKSLGDLKKAEEHYLEALKIWKSCYGDNHPDVATSLNNLGLVYDNLGDLKKAEEHYFSASKITKST